MAFPAFKYKDYVVRVASCGDTTFGILSPPPVCIPPSCGYFTVCSPRATTMAVVKYDPRSNPGELTRLLDQLHELRVDAHVVVLESPDEPAAGMAALQRELQQG